MKQSITGKEILQMLWQEEIRMTGNDPWKTLREYQRQTEGDRDFCSDLLRQIQDPFLLDSMVLHLTEYSNGVMGILRFRDWKEQKRDWKLEFQIQYVKPKKPYIQERYRWNYWKYTRHQSYDSSYVYCRTDDPKEWVRELERQIPELKRQREWAKTDWIQERS